MQSTQATRSQYLTQQRTQKRLLADLRKIWRGMGGDWNTSWARISPDVVGAVSVAQLSMAKSTTDYLDEFLSEVDLANKPTAMVDPSSLIGYSSDGYPLDSLMYGSVVAARTAGAEKGLNAPQSLREGYAWLSSAASSQIADAARTATMLGTAVRPNLQGYTRFLNPPSCSRCAVLAGRVYRYSTGFQRHPRCDCTMQPASSAAWAKSEGFVLDPTEDLSVVKDLTKAQRAAIDAGADLSQVVNAGRGMKVVGEGDRARQITLSGTTARGVYGRAEIAKNGQVVRGASRQQGAVKNYRQSSTVTPRLTPGQIAKQARDRDELVAYLKKYRYIT